MAVASPAIPVANAPAIRFDFAQTRQKVRIQIRFFNSAEAAAGTEIPYGAGSRDVTVTSHSVVTEPRGTDDAYTNPSLESAFVNGTLAGVAALVGGTWAEFELVDGATNLTVRAAVNTTPGGAIAYRVFVTVNDAKVTVI